jgi:glucokinase
MRCGDRTKVKEELYIGLDVGRTIRGALVRGDGAILLQRQVISEVRDPHAFIDQLIEMINGLQASAHASVVAAGIGWPGLVNQQANRVEVAPNILDISSFDLYEELRRATGLQVIFDNDANAGCYGEWRCGAARGYENVFYITMGTGIGAGLILGGQPQRGARGFAGEFGHFKIEVEGLECACGSIGCLETLASGPNIVRRVREKLFSDPSFSVSKLAQDMEGTLTCERIFEAAAQEDELAKSVLSETGVFLGMAVASIINLLNIEIVVLGGGVMAAGELMLREVREAARKRTIPPAYECCKIVAAELGKDAGIVGAAMIARDARSASGIA